MGKQNEWDDMVVISTGAIAGKKIVKTIGMVQVSFARSMKNHQNKIKKKAFKMGANAVVGYSIMGGTAVVIEDE